MRTLLKLTQMLPMLFIGLIIGALIRDNSTLLLWGIVLLIGDVVIGLILQYLVDHIW